MIHRCIMALLATLIISVAPTLALAADEQAPAQSTIRSPEKKFFKLNRSGYAPAARSFYTNKIDSRTSRIRPDEYQLHTPQSSLAASGRLAGRKNFFHAHRKLDSDFPEELSRGDMPLTGNNDQIILSLFEDGKTQTSRQFSDHLMNNESDAEEIDPDDVPLRSLHNLKMFQ